MKIAGFPQLVWFVFFCLGGLCAHAETYDFTLLKASPSRRLGVVKASSKIKVGDRFEFRAFNCEVEVTKRTESKALISFSECANGNFIKKGMGIKLRSVQSVDSFKVFSFNEDSHLLTTKIPRGVTVSEGDEFNVFSPDRKFCKISVTKVTSSMAYADTTGCKIEFELRKGLDMDYLGEGRPSRERQQMLVGGARYPKPEKKERKVVKNPYLDYLKDYYLFSAIGYMTVSYSDAQDQETVDVLSSEGGASHLPLYAEILGAYVPHSRWPMMWGGVFRLERDGYSTSSVTYEVYQYHVAGSLLWFINKELWPTGLFLRGDVGLGMLSSTAITDSNTGELIQDSSATGASLLGGLGYSFSSNRDTFFNIQLNASYRMLGDRGSTVIGLSVGVLW